MTFPAKQDLVVVMSDATGFGSGGVSPVITVGESVHNVDCDTHDNPSTSLNSHLKLHHVFELRRSQLMTSLSPMMTLSPNARKYYIAFFTASR